MTDLPPDAEFTVAPERWRNSQRGQTTRGRINIAVDMMMAGASIVAIANRLDAPPEAVRRWLRMPSAIARIDRIQRETGERVVRALVTSAVGSVLTLVELQRPQDQNGIPIAHRDRIAAAKGVLTAVGLGSRVDVFAALDAATPPIDETDDVLDLVATIESRLERVTIIDTDITPEDTGDITPP